ncbi:MAG: tetratricopeptide repeat protein [Gemmatimonadaceae bacterium]|jgi:tetratricopeptide (TPR) repeat protein|nr:tetratricopeptide repeat protein [Gemmatimonadaceae bacterium]
MMDAVATACAAGVSALDRGAHEEARAHFADALERAPTLLDVRLLVAFALARAGDGDRARAVLDDTPAIAQLVERDARRLADAAVGLKALHAARAAVTTALGFAPRDATLHATLGALADRAGDPRADHHLDRALALDPTLIAALLTRAHRHAARDEWARALHTLDTAVKTAPDHALARYQRGLLLLTLGRFEDGWRDAEARRSLAWHQHATPKGIPAWGGQPLAGRTLLVWGEQGLGDQVQFARFLPALAAASGATLAVRVAPPLVDLLAPLLPAHAHIAPLGDDVRADAHVPMMSLPALLGLHDEWAFTRAPYLPVPAPAITAATSRARARIGICWAGNPAHAHDHARSLPLDAVRTLIDGVDAEWISLQVGAPEHARCADPVLGARISAGASLGTTMRETAQCIASLDRVVTADTAVAHVAAALGVPTTILVPSLPDWRWQRERIDSPWYAAATLARRGRDESWNAVCGRVARTLPGYRAVSVGVAA